MAQARKMAPLKGGPHTDPVGRGTGGGIGWGGLLVAAFGFSFVGYAFDAGGMQRSLDGMFAGWNSAAHTHDAEVQRVFFAVVPVFAALLVLAMLYVLFFARGETKKKTRRKRKKGVAARASQVAKVESAEAMAFIRPVRLSGVAERGVLRETKRPG